MSPIKLLLEDVDVLVKEHRAIRLHDMYYVDRHGQRRKHTWTPPRFRVYPTSTNWGTFYINVTTSSSTTNTISPYLILRNTIT